MFERPSICLALVSQCNPAESGVLRPSKLESARGGKVFLQRPCSSWNQLYFNCMRIPNLGGKIEAVRLSGFQLLIGGKSESNEFLASPSRAGFLSGLVEHCFERSSVFCRAHPQPLSLGRNGHYLGVHHLQRLRWGQGSEAS